MNSPQKPSVTARDNALPAFCRLPLAAGDTGQSRHATDGLLAGWDGCRGGGFGLTTRWVARRAVADDEFAVLQLVALRHEQPDLRRSQPGRSGLHRAMALGAGAGQILIMIDAPAHRPPCPSRHPGGAETRVSQPSTGARPPCPAPVKEFTSPPASVPRRITTSGPPAGLVLASSARFS